MGCDIHGWAEKRVAGKWVAADVSVLDYRAYPSFYIMAGVRDYFEPPKSVAPISTPRGFPKDSAFPEQVADWNEDVDMHSRGYLTLKEILEYPDWDKVAVERGYSDTLRAHAAALWGDVEKLQALDMPPEDIRLVFCFDN